MKKLRYRALVQPANVLWKLSLLIPVTLAAQHPAGAEPHPVRAAEFIVKTFDQYPVVGITDLPGCEELHNLIRSVIREPAFVGKVQDIIVDFGNPLLQPLVDRYLIDGEITPRTLLRHIWDDTTRSVDLTWDSPVYEQFFDAVRSANSGLSRDKRLRVVLADSPIDWNSVKHLADLSPFLDSRSQVLASKINASIAAGRNALVIAFAEHQFRNGRTGNARQIMERAHPGKFFTILTQGRLGVGDGYKAIENAQLSWDLDTVAPAKETWLTNVATSSEPNAPTVEAAAEAVLYLGPSDSLTMLRPSASVFQDESYWKELNRRWMIVRGQPFNLAAARFDLRSRFMDPLPSMPRMPRPPRQTRQTVPRQPAAPIPDGAAVPIGDFVSKQLDRFPIVGIGEVHTCLEFHQILHNLLRDPRLPGKVNDIIVEFGNPSAQEITDRYVLDGEPVSREVLKAALQNTAIGWTISASPLYEYFFDIVREVNAKLPRERRMRIVLGDAPIDVARLRIDPAAALQAFRTSRESPISAVREAALAASVHETISLGHRGLIIAGSGHLRGNGLPGSARQLIDKQHPGKLLYLDNVPVAAAGVAIGSVIVQGDNGSLFIGDVGASQSSVRISPLIFRDPEFWHDINLTNWATNKEWVDLARPEFEYRGRYFEKPWPLMFDEILGKITPQ